MHPDQTHSADELSLMKAEIKELSAGIRCIFAVLTVLPLYYCTRVLLAAPKFEQIFEDMLGSLQKLPVHTRLVLAHSLTVLGFIWLLAVVVIALIFAVKRARLVWISAVLSAFIFTVSGHLLATVLMDPLVTVIQDLSGGSAMP